MIWLVFGSRSKAIFSSPVSPSREPTLGVETESKIPPYLGPKIPAKSSDTGINILKNYLINAGGFIVQAQQKAKIIFLASLFILGGCSSDMAPQGEQNVPMGRQEARKRDFGNLFGEDFLLFGGPKKPTSPGMPSATVNPFIWRASLDTLSFMPLASADAVGGVIVTDWYTVPNMPRERIKVTIYVISPELRADAIKVTIYKQVNKTGSWVNASADGASAIEMENIILSKARQLRIKHREANQ